MSVAAIVLAAGQGTRMKSQTPKVLHKVCGRFLCEYSIDAALKSKPSQVIVVVGHQSQVVQKALESVYPDQLTFVEQKPQNGTAHAVKLCLPHVRSSIKKIVVLCGDTPFLKSSSVKSLLRLASKPSVNMSMCTAILADPTGYGRIVRDEFGDICRIVEHKDASTSQRQLDEVNPGIYCFKTKFLKASIPKIRKSPASGEYYLTDMVDLAAKAKGSGPIPTKVIDPIEMAGINDRTQLAEAEHAMRQRINLHWMKKGVTMLDPFSTYIDDAVWLSPDVILHPGVILRGNTKISKSCEILPYSVIEDTVIHRKCSIGPFARLRPGTEIFREAKVGNFVEVKKSKIRAGSKAGHLAYIGDADVGEGCNIGAGTITCNYDGKDKHPTVLGKNVFIGSNATLVAPLNVGDGAYVAGGSTITDDVESGALAFGRARQVNKNRK